MIAPEGAISARGLIARFGPDPRGSIRALQEKMYARAARQPWAVILCRFKGEAPDPARDAPIEQFYRKAYAKGSGGLVEFWRDSSLGSIDISASRVYGWLEVDIPRAKANTGNGATRSTLVDAAIRAAKAAGNDVETGFHSQLSVYTENWSIDGVPAGLDWRDPVYGQYWIDGSADARGKVSLTPPHNGDITAHEMGHGFGMNHDLGPDLVANYGDVCCIMSQQNAFLSAQFGLAFGPGVCLPHLVQKGWMYPRRLYTDPGGWMGRPGGVQIPLACINDPGSRANLGIKLVFQRLALQFDYYIEYMTPTDWNRGLGHPLVVIRRMAPFGAAQTPAHLGVVEVPATAGSTNHFVEPSGNVVFTAERLDADGRILKIGALKQ